MLPILARDRRAARSHTRRISEWGRGPILEYKFIIAFGLQKIAKPVKIVRDPPLRQGSVLAVREAGDKIGELQQGIGFITGLIISLGSEILGPALGLVVGKGGQPGIVLVDGVVPPCLL